jgi:hypothetical protein
MTLLAILYYRKKELQSDDMPFMLKKQNNLDLNGLFW